MLASAVLASCTSADAPPPPGTSQAPLCKHVEPGKAPLRRLTRFEYDNTVRDLLGDDTHPASQFPPEEQALGFDNQADALGVTQLLAEQYMKASEGIAARATADVAKILPCDPKVDGEDACAAKFIDAFGARAFRRPIDSTSHDRAMGLYSWGKATYGFSTGIAVAIEGFLQSPQFLYRVELTGTDPIEGDVVALDDFEIATRLSYLLWGSMPDQALFDAAKKGELETRDQLKAQAERMLADQRARAAVARFHTEWLGIEGVDSVDKDTKTFPEWKPELGAMFRRETEALVERIVFDDDGDVTRLFTAPYTMANSEIAAFYGVKGPKGDDFAKVDLDPKERSGILTQPSVLATYAKSNRSSPVHRGKLVRERFFCQPLSPPPPNVPEPPPVDPHSTLRQQFAQHETDPNCASCHKLMDPVGFGFEHYDGIGAWRDEENGFAVDATGEVKGTVDSDGKFDGAIELAKRLAKSEQVRECVATQWFRYGYGRAEQDEDSCNLDTLNGAFAKAGFNIKALLIALTQTDAFRYRHRIAPGK